MRCLGLGGDRLTPVASPALAAQLGRLEPGITLPLLMYQQGGFLAEVLVGSCLPRLIRDYRVETICESVFSASLKEMALAGMDLAWLAGDLIRQEIADRRLLPLGAELGEAELDILLYYRDTPAAACIADVIAGRAGGR